MFEQALFGFEEVGFDAAFAGLERIQLDETAWIDHQPMWLSGDAALFDCLTEGAEWTQPLVRMFDKQVLTPRLVSSVDPAVHPVIPELIASLSHRYEVELNQVSAGWYRDGSDSVAYHGDRIAREIDTATVATVSLGSPRRFSIRPKGGGPGRSFSLGHGDLVVMGGTCQRTWQHAVPKVKSAGPRIALMFRHRYE